MTFASTLPADALLLDLHAHFLINGTLLGTRFDRRHPRRLPWNPFETFYDLPRAREGGVGGCAFTMYVPSVWPEAWGGGIRALAAQRRRFDGILAECGGRVRECTSAAAIRAAAAHGVFAAWTTLEGAAVLDGSEERLETMLGWGVRMVTPVHVRGNALADGVWGGQRHGGLSEVGRRTVRELERRGVLIDLTHAPEPVFRALVREAGAPRVVSHTAARARGAGERGISDEQLDALRDGDGLVGLTLFPWYLRPRGVVLSSDEVAEHAAYVAARIGVRHLAVGSDMDANIWLPRDMRDASSFPVLLEAFRRRGFTQDEVRLIAGENWLRVLEATDPAFHSARAAAGGRAGRLTEESCDGC